MYSAVQSGHESCVPHGVSYTCTHTHVHVHIIHSNQDNILFCIGLELGLLKHFTSRYLGQKHAFKIIDRIRSYPCNELHNVG